MNTLQKKLFVSALALAVAAIPVLAHAQEFTALTNLPGLGDTLSSDTLPSFLNQLYKLCIGAAAVIAVLQIMRAGTKYFFYTGSVSQNQAAKDLIKNSLLGLLLVLSPAIVFGIINPDILNLSLNFEELKPPKIEDVFDDIEDKTKDPQGPIQTITGTLLRKGTFPNEGAVNAYIPQCNSLRNTLVANIPAESVKIYNKGCTQSCSPAGQGACDAKGCKEYTAYCGIQASATPLIQGNQYKPTPQDSYKWSAFTATCESDGGAARFRPSGQPESCFDENDMPARCVRGVMSCEPK